MKLPCRILFFFALLFATSAVYGQQTGITGRVTDTTGAVIAGAQVQVKQVSGASFTTRSNSDGIFLVPSLVAGSYTVTVSAPGFNTVQTKVTMLVGQTPEVDTILPIGDASQSVIVRSDESTVDTTSSTVAGNITPNQVEGLPINGRNYMELATLVPGVRTNAVTNDTPLGGNNTGKFEITLDGLQVTQDTADPSFGEPRFSPDAISQFQIITNRFDATLGRSEGIYVNVQSKIGTNVMHGSVFGYFRNDAFNSADPVIHSVIPLSDQQYGATVGGPIRHDKLWYFTSYEGEHQASDAPTISLLPGSSAISLPQVLTVNEYLGRADYELNDKNHFIFRGNGFTFNNNKVIFSGFTDPSAAFFATRSNYTLYGEWNRVISTKLVNNLHAAFNHFQWQNLPQYSTIQLTFGSNITVGGPYNFPQIFDQNVQQYRDDLSYLTGKHSFKIGAEYMYTKHSGFFQQNVRGTVSGCNSITTAAQAAAVFPNGTTDPTTWNYSNGSTNLDSLCALGTYTQGSGNFNINIPRNQIGFWAQDDYKVLTRLTLNLGIRYDNDLGVFNTGLALNNGLLTPKSNDNHQVAPRIGFVADPTGSGKTVIRGGAGLFFADIAANQVIDEQIFNGVTSLQESVTGTASSPLNLQTPFANAPAIPRQAVQPLAPNVSTPYSLQLSAGVQRELPFQSVITADYVHTRVYHDWIRLNSNLLQNPANPIYNISPSTKYVAGTPVVCPDGGVTPDVSQGTYAVCAQAFTAINQFFTPNAAGSIYDALQLGVHQSLHRGLSSAVAYTYSRYKDSTESPFYFPNEPFVSGVHNEWGPAQDDQRHTLTVTGEYQLKYGLSLSSLFHYGSGNAFPTYVGTTPPTGYFPSYNRTFGANVTPVAYLPSYGAKTCAAASGMDTPCIYTYNKPGSNFFDTTSGYWQTKRDALYGRNIYRVDTRLQESHKFHERYTAAVAVEAFNMFNHSNYGTYNGVVTSPLYGTPQSTTAAATGIPVEWRPRSLQFVGRFDF